MTQEASLQAKATAEETLEARLQLLRQLIDDASNALLSFYSARLGGFIRDSDQTRRLSREDLGRTSTNRAVFALVEYLRYLHEEAGTSEDVSRSKRIQLIGRILRRVAREYLSDIKWSRATSAAEVNMYTDSHLLMTIGLLRTVETVAPGKIDRALVGRARRAGSVIARVNTFRLHEWCGGRVFPEDDIHDFVTLHCLRGLDVWNVAERDTPTGLDLPQPFAGRMRDSILQQMGYASLGVNNKFDPAELLFQIAILNRLAVPDVDEISARALDIVLKSQHADGSWPTGRLISISRGGPRRLLHVSSYEVALAMVNLLLRNLRESQLPRGVGPRYLLEETLRALDKSVELVAASYTTTGHGHTARFLGWSNDRTLGSKTLASWVTAVVLTFLIHYRDALLLLRQQDVLRRRGAERYPRPFPPWPDLDGALRRPRRLENGVLAIQDPSKDGTLEGRLAAEYLVPVTDDWVRRPRKSSLILYGPPGTGKTTIAKRMARALHWPVLRLSPPDFLREGGLEQFEASADRLFRDLMSLRRCVVVFDECEGMFLKRDAVSRHVDVRTPGAFITPGMLPRIQRLYEQRWVIFVLTTNLELEQLDPAVTRRGRFDHAQRLGHPTVAAQIRHLRQNHVSSRWIGRLEPVLLERSRDLESEDAPLTFGALDELSRRVSTLRARSTDENLRTLVDRVAKRAWIPESLVP